MDEIAAMRRILWLQDHRQPSIVGFLSGDNGGTTAGAPDQAQQISGLVFPSVTTPAYARF